MSEHILKLMEKEKAEINNTEDLNKITELIEKAKADIENRIFVTEEVYRKRLNICLSNSCKKMVRDKENKPRCSLCGCDMSVKNKNKDWKCPIGKF